MRLYNIQPRRAWEAYRLLLSERGRADRGSAKRAETRSFGKSLKFTLSVGGSIIFLIEPPTSEILKFEDWSKKQCFFNQSQKMIPLARVTSRTELKTWIRFWNRLNWHLFGHAIWDSYWESSKKACISRTSKFKNHRLVPMKIFKNHWFLTDLNV